MPPDPAQAILDLPSQVPLFVGELVADVGPAVYALLTVGVLLTLGISLIRKAL